MKKKKAEMGIGTLIIFIAMILVAAVAAGVLIQTASSLQSQALLTGERSKEQIGTNMQALEVTAQNGSDQNVEYFYETVKLSPGSGEINLNDALLVFETSSNVAYLQYGGMQPICSYDRDENGTGSNGFYTEDATNDGYFTVQYESGGISYGYITSSDIVIICYESPGGSLGTDQRVKVSLVPRIGTPLVLDLMTPASISNYIEHIYP